MDLWPTDDRVDVVTVVGRKANGKGKEKARNYPLIEQGAFKALTLVEHDAHLSWTSVVNKHSQDSFRDATKLQSNLATHTHKPHHLKLGKHASIFPATRPPLLRLPPATVSQRSEQGANFLRTFLPDVDVAAELIRAQVAEDTILAREYDAFDPSSGNILESLYTRDTSAKNFGFLVFPMGEVGRDLNFSALRFSKTQGKYIIKPSTVGCWTFDTPIQQIKVSNGRKDDYLAVRTFGSTSLFQFEPNSSSRASPLSKKCSIVRSDVGNRAIVDVQICDSSFEVLLVNDSGTIYSCNPDQGGKNMIIRHSISSEHKSDSFWRIRSGLYPSDCILISNSKLTQVDFRSQVDSDLLALSDPRELLTSVEDVRDDNLIRLCSTKQILWMDRRFPGKPLLGYKHGRQFDRYLETCTVHSINPLTMLTTRKNALLTVYDVSRSEARPMHVHSPPYCLFPSNGDGPHIGQTFLEYTSLPGPSFGMVRMSVLGEIQHIDISSAESQTSALEVRWTHEVETLSNNLSEFTSDIGPLGTQEFSEVDLFPIYDKIFRLYTEDINKAEIQDREEVYELLEHLASYWQDTNEPVEHLLTTYDIVFRAGNQPRESSRADFLTQGVINSTRGFRALLQGRLASQPLTVGASWNTNISRILHVLDTEEWSTTEGLTDGLRRFDLVHNTQCTFLSVKRQTTAREQLTLDLALSTNVFSGYAFAKPSDCQALETMTENLSLDGEPAPVDFGFLRPVQKASTYYKRDHEDEDEERVLSFPISVRLLLKDWEVGVDPQEFVYIDPYDDTTEPNLRRPLKAKPAFSSREEGAQTFAAQSQRPPMVVASNSISIPTDAARSVPTRIQSQGLPHIESQFSVPSTGASQELVTSTQVLPGPYGGRPIASKKKAAKKRLGGF